MRNSLEKILLVDDDEISNFITKTLLVKMGIGKEYITLRNGQQALDYISGHSSQVQESGCPDFMLLDINMPVMNGIEFLKHIRQNNIPISFPIVVCTTSSNPKELDELIEMKVKIVEKPLDPSKLLYCLEECLDTTKFSL